jgi:hypothetical protein
MASNSNLNNLKGDVKLSLRTYKKHTVSKEGSRITGTVGRRFDQRSRT